LENLRKTMADGTVRAVVGGPIMRALLRCDN
jgi:hypothetical protein